MNIDEETRRKIIDLRIQHKKKIREIVSEVGKSSRDITTVLREHEIQQSRTMMDQATMDDKRYDKDSSAQAQYNHELLLPNVKAYNLFEEGKNPLEVAAELNLPGPQVQQYYGEYWNLRRMHRLVAIYPEIQDSMGYFLKLFRLGKQEGLTPEQVIGLIQLSDSIHKLQDKLQHLQSEVLDISKSKTVAKDELKGLHNEIEAAQEKLNLVNKTFEVKYEELKEACSQAQKLQDYIERFKNSQEYEELKSTVRSEVEKTLLDNKKLLQNALFSILLALRNQPDRYYIVDSMELTHFTTAIINYNSLALKRPRNEQLFTKRILEMAEKILYNLQKSIVDSTISAAAGL